MIAKMPEVAALIYRCKFKDGKVTKDHSLDYTGNYCAMMGYDDKAFQDLMRLYLVIHSVSPSFGAGDWGAGRRKSRAPYMGW